MAEGGTPVNHGANLRFSALMSDPPVIQMVLDTGNSGAYGVENATDQMLLWHAGKKIQLPLDWSKALKASKQSLVLTVP